MVKCQPRGSTTSSVKDLKKRNFLGLTSINDIKSCCFMQFLIFNKLFIEDYKDIIKPQSPFHLWFFSKNWKLEWMKRGMKTVLPALSQLCGVVRKSNCSALCCPFFLVHFCLLMRYFCSPKLSFVVFIHQDK